jgi:hypothetical protein
MVNDSLPRGPGLFRLRPADGTPLVTNIRRIAGREVAPGERLIAAATVLLGLLGAGFLYVSLNAQFRYVFAVKHQSAASMVEAAGLDAGMIIFSLLALGLARAGQPARTERALILACALASAGMNYEAASTASVRSVAVYVMPPVFLAVVVDRVIAVVRRWVVGDTERSAWSALGRALLAVLRLAGLVVLYLLRLVLDPATTAKGLRLAVLVAAPLPGAHQDQAENAQAMVVLAELGQVVAKLGSRIDGPDGLASGLEYLRARLDRMVETVQDLAAGEPAFRAYPTKKAAFLAAYRSHAAYGDRGQAAKVAGELAEAAGLQPGTARSYAYEELARLDPAAGEAAEVTR